MQLLWYISIGLIQFTNGTEKCAMLDELGYVPLEERARTVRPQMACKMRRTRRRLTPGIMAAADDARERVE